jgi:hypothetical protein
LKLDIDRVRAYLKAKAKEFEVQSEYFQIRVTSKTGNIGR